MESAGIQLLKEKETRWKFLWNVVPYLDEDLARGYAIARTAEIGVSRHSVMT